MKNLILPHTLGLHTHQSPPHRSRAAAALCAERRIISGCVHLSAETLARLIEGGIVKIGTKVTIGPSKNSS